MRNKRRKEKARHAKEARESEGPRKRLVKAPPTNKFSRIVLLGENSTPSDLLSNVPSFTDLEEIRPMPKASKGRSGVDIGSKAFMKSTEAIPGPWKVAYPAHLEQYTPQRHNDRFIGGIKLKKSEQAHFLERMDNHELVDTTIEAGSMSRDDAVSATSEKARLAGVQGGIKGDGDVDSAETLKLLSLPSLIPSRNAAQSSVVRPSSIGNATIIVDKENEPGQIYTQPVSKYTCSSSETGPESFSMPQCRHQRHFASSSRSSRPTTADHKHSNIAMGRHRASRMTDGPPISYREPPVLSAEPFRGRVGSRSYSQDQRQRSRDRAFNNLEDEDEITSVAEITRYHSRRRSWSISSIASRIRRSNSTARTTSGNTPVTTISHKRDDNYSLHNCTFSPSPEFQSPVTSLSETPLPPNRKSLSSPTASSFRGFKNMAKTAFARHLHSGSDSTTSTLAGPSTTHGARLRLSISGSNDSSYSDSDSGNRVLGAAATTMNSVTRDGIEKPRPPILYYASTNIPSKNETRKFPELARESGAPASTSRESHIKQEPQPRSVTDSSEDLLDESTQASTPVLSISLSQNKLLLPTCLKEESMDICSRRTSGKHLAPCSGPGLPYDTNSNRQEYQERTTAPLDGEEDKEGPEVASAINAFPDLPATQLSGPIWQGERTGPQSTTETTQSPPQSVNGRDKSVSSSDFNDLRFLPKPIPELLVAHNGKRKEEKSCAKGPQTSRETSTKSKSAKARIKSAPLVSCVGPSPTPSNGLGHGQHLRDAGIEASKKRRFPNVRDAKASMIEVEPLAKMLVLCCSCRYFHDMPSKLYGCMTKPDDVVEDKELGVSGMISIAVKCPWCGHGMSTTCCEGYSAVVYLTERFH